MNKKQTILNLQYVKNRNPMRIPNLDNDAKTNLNLPLTPKVIEIIEKMALKPSTIEKLLLSAQNALVLDLTPLNTKQKLDIKQISLPLKISSQIASLAQSQIPIKISISITNKQVVLELFNPDTSDQPLKLYFKNAKLLNTNLLKLTGQVSPNLAKAETINLTPNTDKLETAGPLSKNKEVQLQQAISTFLKAKPFNEKPLANSLNKLVNLEQKLSASFSQKLESNGTLLNRNQINEVLNTINQLMPEQKQVKDLIKLLSTLENLKQGLDFSKQNKQLKLAQRVASSGSFLESKVTSAHIKNSPSPFETNLKHPAQLERSTFNNSASNKQLTNDKLLDNSSKNHSLLMESNKAVDIKAPLNQKADLNSEQLRLANSKVPSSSTDLKLNLLSIKQTVRSLLQALNISNASPIHSNNLIKLLAQHPELLKSISGSELENNKTNLHLNSSTSTSNNKENLNAFDPNSLSTQLRKTILSSLRLPSGIQATNLKQEINLLNIQKLILTEFLNETTTLVSKIETNQLLSLRSETPLLQQFLVDLPILHNKQIESFELLFTAKKEDDSSKNNKKWTVTIKFDLEPLGPMFARVSLKNERISTHFFAEDPETAELLSDNLKHLKDSLFLAGLDVDEISGQQGIVPEQLLENDEHSIDVHV
jgi:hypothetical protein